MLMCMLYLGLESPKHCTFLFKADETLPFELTVFY